jgi:UDP-N-acetylglucosamine transferase subunit ALG13
VKILITVGAQMPFDRLISAVDNWAGLNPQHSYLAQIGQSNTTPRYMNWERLLDTQRFQQEVIRADLLIAHAGMGSILTALNLQKPIVVMPRRGCLRETRNDHQLATARQLSEAQYVAVAEDEQTLYRWLDSPHLVPRGTAIGKYASQPLLNCIHDFIHAPLDRSGVGMMSAWGGWSNIGCIGKKLNALFPQEVSKSRLKEVR